MPQFIRLPRERLDPDTLQGLLEEFASRDGTDYGARERSLEEKVARLQRQLQAGELCLLYELESQEWDLMLSDQAQLLLED